MHDQRLCGGGRMQVVGLELLGRYAFKHEWDQCGAISFCQPGIDRTELPGVFQAVVRRDLYAEQQYPGVRFPDLFDDHVQVLFHTGDAPATQPVVCAQFKDDDCGLMLLQGPGDAPQSAGRGLAADAGVHHFELGVIFFQRLLQ